MTTVWQEALQQVRAGRAELAHRNWVLELIALERLTSVETAQGVGPLGLRMLGLKMLGLQLLGPKMLGLKLRGSRVLARLKALGPRVLVRLKAL
jgi:hypothetical protein